MIIITQQFASHFFTVTPSERLRENWTDSDGPGSCFPRNVPIFAGGRAFRSNRAFPAEDLRSSVLTHFQYRETTTSCNACLQPQLPGCKSAAGSVVNPPIDQHASLASGALSPLSVNRRKCGRCTELIDSWRRLYCRVRRDTARDQVKRLLSSSRGGEPSGFDNDGSATDRISPVCMQVGSGIRIVAPPPRSHVQRCEPCAGNGRSTRCDSLPPESLGWFRFAFPNWAAVWSRPSAALIVPLTARKAATSFRRPNFGPIDRIARRSGKHFSGDRVPSLAWRAGPHARAQPAVDRARVWSDSRVPAFHRRVPARFGIARQRWLFPSLRRWSGGPRGGLPSVRCESPPALSDDVMRNCQRLAGSRPPST